MTQYLTPRRMTLQARLPTRQVSPRRWTFRFLLQTKLKSGEKRKCDSPTREDQVTKNLIRELSRVMWIWLICVGYMMSRVVFKLRTITACKEGWSLGIDKCNLSDQWTQNQVWNMSRREKLLERGMIHNANRWMSHDLDEAITLVRFALPLPSTTLGKGEAGCD